MLETHIRLIDESAKGHVLHTRHCDGCGRSVLRGALTGPWPVRWGEVLFCDDCVRTASREEIERRRSEIALRGVPMS